MLAVGLIPFRAWDSYNAWFVVKYHRKSLRVRKERGLPELADINDLPNNQTTNSILLESGKAEDAVLSDEEQEIFTKHQIALNKSHCTWALGQMLNIELIVARRSLLSST